MGVNAIHHALGLNLHQPPGNLRLLMEVNPWEAEQVIRCYERIPRYALRYRDVACLHVSFSGVLLEQLLDPVVVDRFRHIVDIPAMLAAYRAAENIELIATGHYYPIFPLIARADWSEQIARGRAILTRALGRVPSGFWPPELAFTMTMIPALVQAGYDYVIVDAVHVRPSDGINDGFRPYLACHEGVCITIVPRDRALSDAQESGFDPDWLSAELTARVSRSARPHERRLATTWCDGENGGWFRQTHEASGFFGHFFAPYVERIAAGTLPIELVRLSDYLGQVRASAHARVQSGAWNVGSASGVDLSRWAGSAAQQGAVAELQHLSARYWDLVRRLGGPGAPDGPLARARDLILEAQTSCFLVWGETWLPQLYHRTSVATAALDALESGGAQRIV
ncbi:MAG: glycoside hydrolase family 57 [Sphingobacteriia bacterium]|nr:glycoside hydrolase family 57 [Sphingobacteriia bacterium]NCC39112.1 glycoside hydrolase family 57 [Gammaproteobacteria bacterium]